MDQENLKCEIVEISGEKYKFMCNKTTTVLDLKFEMYKKTKIDISKQRMIYSGKDLEDDELVHKYENEKNDEINIYFVKVRVKCKMCKGKGYL